MPCERANLLIIDEWLLSPVKDSDSRELLEIAEARYKKASAVFCSQCDIGGWHEKIGDPTLADAICDRIAHDSYTVLIGGGESMRKRKGLKA
ncbi:MAG: ATP-binding protein [Clostridiales Family XIII bacterium]|jgi:DNA replication protein DnaC|nr:ATP-binding protein [Clostridiales Family XIII bacterium]